MTPSYIYPYMRGRYRKKVRSILTLALLTLLLPFAPLGNTAQAEEPWQPFLKSLRDAGYHDMALLYLDRMADRPDCPAELKEVLDYERGITLLSQPLSSRKEQIAKLTEANRLFQQFRKAHPQHALAVKAQTQLANVLIERGRMLVEDSEEPTVSDTKRKKLLTEARSFYEQAKKVSAEQDKILTAELKNLPKPKTAAKTQHRDTLRTDFLQTRLALATIDYEIGMTYSPKSSQRKKLLQSSAKQYHYLYDKYGNLLAGLYARMWEGRSYQKLGDLKRAQDAFESILLLSDDSKAFRTLKNKSLVLLLETLLDPKMKKYADALGFYDDWDKERPPSEISTPEGLEIRYLAGVAALRQARSLDKKDRDRKKRLAEARESFQFVMRFPGKVRAKAREKMADPLLAVGDSLKKGDPRDFAEAVDFARGALDKIEITALRNQLGKEKLGPKELQKIKETAEQEALGYFEQALKLAKPKTPAEEKEVDWVRRNIAYLVFQQGELSRAADLAEDLANRHKDRDSELGRSAATIAMAASNLMSTKPDLSQEEKAAAAKRAEKIAALIVEIWLDSKEAGDAHKVLIHAVLRNKDLKKAIDMVEAIPRTAASCGPLQILVGRALYAEYVRQITATKNEDQSDTQDSATSSSAASIAPEELLKQAKRFLLSGLNLSVEEQKIDRSFLLGELTLARIYLDAGEDAQAIPLVERPDTGLLALANAADPSVIEGGLDIEAYKISLRALVAARKLDQASSVMKQLEDRVTAADQAGNGTQLMQIYISLARELKQTLDLLQKSGKTAEATQVRASFEQFLDRVAGNQEAVDFNVLQWIAATFSGLGDSYEKTGGTAVSPEAEKYYEKAVTVYQQLLARYQENENFAPSLEAIDAIEIRMAICLRELGRYKDALRHLFNVLQYRNTMVDAQIEAALTYQAWAGTQGGAKRYLNAMLGGASKTRKSDGAKVNVIWGWGKLSKRLARNKKYRDLFHEARYNLALCRYRYALSDACGNREKNLEAAERDIKVIAKLYPNMGGDAMKQQYIALYKKIQQALKK